MSFLFRGRQQGAQQVKISLGRRFLTFWLHHAQQCIGSLGELARYPFASLMTMAVLGLSLTLPATLYVIVKNTDAVGANFQQASEMTLFLRQDLSEQEVATFHKRVQVNPAVASTRLIDKAAGLADFRQRSGFGEALDTLENNPLPDVLIVTPAESYRHPAAAEQLLQQMQQQREVDQARLDVGWLQRFQAIVRLIQDGFLGLALLLSIAVVLIVGNTIRLNISSKRDEIAVMKLVGATDAYIQRPFLYTGLWYGLLGGVITWIATGVLLWWLSAAVRDIAELYDSQFRLTGLNITEMGVVWGFAIGIGLLGSYLAVRKHVRAIEPQ
ncbi:cell division protein FtsX [Pseudidiomarina sediminum]|uniref:Cell division protein FtsX n=1 Tax=Pseudidiomarina sediminum TaxID=431675 RepID=A0A432ZAC2_9GAMM|nr:permease-like cell division protein FtsX [Pseudidiomarina sediminum]MBY6064056.1 permease-like cell division protein FtsX [Pseudidiomarina sediminum]RUO74851.1 cell division protein FtsX [Pseudidiomarina sediminum]